MSKENKINEENKNLEENKTNEENKSFEESLNELESIVTYLEAGNVSLDEAIEKYSKAMKLAKLCSDKLTHAEEKVNKILKENGELEDFEVTE